MNRGRLMARALPLLVGIGLFLAGCVAEPAGYGGYVYDPLYGSVGVDVGGWGGWHHGWDHGHWDHGHWGHAGWGHGFAHGGFGEHGGFGGHGGGGHR
jgi:hypothetical protein